MKTKEKLQISEFGALVAIYAENAINALDNGKGVEAGRFLGNLTLMGDLIASGKKATAKQILDHMAEAGKLVKEQRMQQGDAIG